ncbi:hypothetical protein EZV62_010815 [Acer yangbiense]|uniref:CCHC-type domain-containing protein n=1 Tax=Acer yangbiense TaxID=1000413 RepID=A0A5C7I3J8_9ROSI|nr:hypothetical protein EZV62_010815 [Acer yangbiense]
MGSGPGRSPTDRLCENLSLVDEDEAVLEITEDATLDSAKDVDLCLVGKVLLGKKVNREAFKGLIEQIWSPFGQVEVELVADNIFMFYFNKQEERNCVWQRGPWHFGKSLIALAIPQGSVTLWRYQLTQGNAGGKFMRVKVRIDISKPLKQWLCLKLSKNEEIIVVSMKYKRLPEFCFTCGRVGHGIMECLDVEARKLALEGTPTKFSSWLKASSGEKQYTRYNSQSYESSSDKVKSNEGSKEGEGDGSISLRPGSLASLKGMSVSVGAASNGKIVGTLALDGGTGSQSDEMCVDGPGNGPPFPHNTVDFQSKVKTTESLSGPNEKQITPAQNPKNQKNIVSTPKTKTIRPPDSLQIKAQTNETSLLPYPVSQNKARKWKRNARENKHQLKPGIVTNSVAEVAT